MPNSEHLHHGHRARLKEKLINFGPDSFSDHELLEVLLYFSIPRTNTNDLAHTLINTFGSLEGVFNADYERLILIDGVGENTALLLTLIGALNSRNRKKQFSKRKKYSDLRQVGEMLTEYYHGIEFERFCALYFDASMRLIEISVISEGTIGEVSVTPSKIAREAVIKGASSVIVAHNHPLGASSLSNSDRNLTHLIEATLAAVEIPLIEHVVVGEVGYSPTMMFKSNSPASSIAKKIYGDSFIKSFYSF